jgi:predicted RNA-binding protein YlxR (DUF448 family)
VVVDPSGRLAGRGAYVCSDPSCRTGAAAPGVLSKALGTPFPPELRVTLAGTVDTNTNQEGISGTK